MTLWFRCSFGDLLKAVPAIQTDSKDIWLREIFPFVTLATHTVSVQLGRVYRKIKISPRRNPRLIEQIFVIFLAILC